MRRETTLPLLFGRSVTAIHCVGIAGMGVGPLAIYLAQRGFRVSGEDDSMTEAMRTHLEREKITLTLPGAIPSACDLVVCSTAISPQHPSFAAATARQLTVVRRGSLLAEVTRDKKLVAICGSHGKTTTTAMLITILRRASFPAGYVLGGLFSDESIAPARHGSNDWVVAEIDESDGTIAQFSPEITVAVNLDWDHPDHYRALADLEATFASLFQRTKLAVLLNDACLLSSRIAANPGTKTFLTFGRTGDFRSRIENDRDNRLVLALNGRFQLTNATVAAQGEFNASNATAALAAGQLMGVTLSSSHMADYPGVRRRQTALHTTEELVVIEDYAHHPAEIRALLSSLCRRTTGRLLTVFQPHRFSRTAQFKAEFAAALAGADHVYLLDVYGAGEGHIAGGTTADLYAELRTKAATLPVSYCPGHPQALLEQLRRDVRRGDWVAFVGAGDIDQYAREWVGQIAEEQQRAMHWDLLAEQIRDRVGVATKVKREESLAEKTTMRVGGAARIYVEPANTDDLRETLIAAKRENVSVHILGRGSNLLVPDEGVDGVVISLAQSQWQTFEPRSEGRLWVGAGLRLKNLCGLATKAGLAGFEFLEGIPGNVGGALRMNAGAMGGWMFDVVEAVQVMTREGELRMLRKEEMHVDYRHCAELHDAIALGALLRPKAETVSDNITRQIDVYRDKRQKSQPREPSAGCIFKNPPGSSAGKLIDEAGLKGERVGDAEVSPVHANFIVNRGRATSSDVIELVRRVRARVEQVKGVTLEPEVLLYGKAWKDVL